MDSQIGSWQSSVLLLVVVATLTDFGTIAGSRAVSGKCSTDGGSFFVNRATAPIIKEDAIVVWSLVQKKRSVPIVITANDALALESEGDFL